MELIVSTGINQIPAWDEKCEQCGQKSLRTFRTVPHICSRCFADNRRADMERRKLLCEVSGFEEHGRDMVAAICPRCEHETVSYGTTDKSVKRCLALLREECPEGETNYYFAGALNAEDPPQDRDPNDPDY